MAAINARICATADPRAAPVLSRIAPVSSTPPFIDEAPPPPTPPPPPSPTPPPPPGRTWPPIVPGTAGTHWPHRRAKPRGAGRRGNARVPGVIRVMGVIPVMSHECSPLSEHLCWMSHGSCFLRSLRRHHGQAVEDLRACPCHAALHLQTHHPPTHGGGALDQDAHPEEFAKIITAPGGRRHGTDDARGFKTKARDEL